MNTRRNGSVGGLYEWYSSMQSTREEAAVKSPVDRELLNLLKEADHPLTIAAHKRLVKLRAENILLKRANQEMSARLSRQ